MGREEQKRFLHKSMEWAKHECARWQQDNHSCSGCDLKAVCEETKKIPAKWNTGKIKSAFQKGKR